MKRQHKAVVEQKKSVIIIFIVLGFMTFYSIRLLSLQIIDTYIYSNQADEISRRQQIIPTRRGEIFDRNFDQPLVTSVDSFVILLDLSAVPSQGLQALIGRLGQTLDTQEEYLWNNIPLETKQNVSTYEIWNDATYRQIISIAENIDIFPGVSWESRPVRHYPQGSLLAHVLGYTGQISPEELQILYNQGYAGVREVGKTGIEKQYDNLLRGSDGINYDRVDARGKRIRELEDIPPKLGDSLVLTIDRHIQLLAEKALGKRTGGIVVLDPSNGDILAMASYPAYDPNIFSRGGGGQQIVNIQNDPRSPLLNRTIQAAGSPASTFKMIMSLAMLQENAFDPHRTIYCPGSLFVGNQEFRCHLSSGHGSVNFNQALAQSCNVYFYTIGKDYLGVDGILDYSLKFGLGAHTTIDLPGEVRGLVPTPEWKNRTYDEPWVKGDTVNLSIGQGFLTVTPLQLANITAGIMNGGIIYQPHLLKEIRDQTSLKLISETQPSILRDTGIDSTVFEKVQAAMRGVIINGTPRSVITSTAMDIAGKTGTAETGIEDNLHSWFTAYMPADSEDQEQKYVVTVWIDGFNDWEWWAPKAANIVMHGIAKRLTFEQSIQDLQPLWYYPISRLSSNL